MHLDLAGLNPVITWSGIDRTKAYLSSNLDIIAFLGSRTWVRRNGGRQFQSASAKLSRKRLGFFSGYKPSKLYIATPSICVILTKLVFQGQEFKRHLGQWQQGNQHLFILYHSHCLFPIQVIPSFASAQIFIHIIIPIVLFFASYSLFCFAADMYPHCSGGQGQNVAPGAQFWDFVCRSEQEGFSPPILTNHHRNKRETRRLLFNNSSPDRCTCSCPASPPLMSFLPSWHPSIR